MLLVGEICKTLRLGIRKLVASFKWDLVGHHRSRDTEDSSAEGDLDYAGLAQEVSEGKNINK